MYLVFVFQEEKRVYLKEIILQIAENCEDEIANKIGVDLSGADFITSCSISLRLRDEEEGDGEGEQIIPFVFSFLQNRVKAVY